MNFKQQDYLKNHMNPLQNYYNNSQHDPKSLGQIKK